MNENEIHEDEIIEDEEILDDEQNEDEETEKVLPPKKENPYIKVIADYIQSVLEEDTALKNSFIDGMDEECFSYITENARKESQGNCAMIEDNVVFKWARDFYNDGIALARLNERKEKEEKEKLRKEKKEKEEKRKKELEEFYSKPMKESSETYRNEDFTQLELF